MPNDVDPDLAEALETQRGDALLARISAIEADREARADPIYPSDDDLAMDVGEARALLSRYRAIRDAHLGELAVDRSELPGEPQRVASAIVVAAQADAAAHTGKAQRAVQRASAEDLVDLQSFRPSEEIELIAGATGAERDAALERLLTAKAGAITLIRDDPSVTGSMNALRGKELTIGNARPALDAVNRYREGQAFWFLALFIGVPVVVGIVVVVAILVVVNS